MVVYYININIMKLQKLKKISDVFKKHNRNRRINDLLGIKNTEPKIIDFEIDYKYSTIKNIK